MAQEKSPIQPATVLPTTCLWLPSLKDKILSPQVGVMYIKKTISGNLKCFYLDENRQEVSVQVLAKNFSNNDRFKVLLNGLENTTAVAPLTPLDSAEFIELAFKLRRVFTGLKFHSEGEMLSVVKKIKQGEMPGDVKPEELEPVDDGYIVWKVSTTEIKFDPVKKDNENSADFWSHIQKNIKLIRRKHGRERLAALSGEVSNERSNIQDIEQKIDKKSKELQDSCLALKAYKQDLNNREAKLTLHIVELDRRILEYKSAVEIQQLSTDYSVLLAEEKKLAIEKQDKLTLYKADIDKKHTELSDLIERKEFYLSEASMLEKKINILRSNVDIKKIIDFLDKIDSIFASRPHIINALNQDIFASTLNTLDLETLLELRMLLKELHIIYADLTVELYSPDYNIIPSLATDSYILNQKTSEIRAVINQRIAMLKLNITDAERRAVYNEMVKSREFFLKFLAFSYIERYPKSTNNAFEKLHSHYKGEIISIGEFVFLCQIFDKTQEFFEKIIDAAKNSAVQNAVNEEILGDELLCFMRFAIIAEETYLFVRAQPARNHRFISVAIRNFHGENKEIFDAFLRDFVSLLNDGYITIEDVEECAKNKSEKTRLMNRLIKEAKMKREQIRELPYTEIQIMPDNHLIKIKQYILEKTNENFELNISLADLLNGINSEESKTQPQFSFPSFFSFIKTISPFQEKAFLFLQNVFKEESFEGVICVLAEAAKANSEDSVFFETLIKQSHQFQEVYTVPPDSAENKSGLSNMTQSC